VERACPLEMAGISFESEAEASVGEIVVEQTSFHLFLEEKSVAEGLRAGSLAENEMVVGDQDWSWSWG
jgi:hypothetical protein